MMEPGDELVKSCKRWRDLNDGLLDLNDGMLAVNDGTFNFNNGMFAVFTKHIASRLPYGDLLRAELVCKKWREGCRSHKMRDIKTGTCLVKFKLHAKWIPRSIYRKTTIQIHNPLQRDSLQCDVLGWPEDLNAWCPSERWEAGNNGLFVLWRAEPVSGNFGQDVHHLTVLNPLGPCTRTLPIFQELDSSLTQLKMVQSDKRNPGQEYSIVLFIGKLNPRLAIFRSSLRSWRTCHAWPPFLDPPLVEEKVICIRRSCSGGRLYCLFEISKRAGNAREILNYSVWRYDLETDEWSSMGLFLPKTVSIEGRFSRLTLAGCGDTILIVVTGGDQDYFKCVSEGSLMRATAGSKIGFVHIWELDGRRWPTFFCLSKMPARYVELMHKAKCFHVPYLANYIVLDAEEAIYFCADQESRFEDIVMFDCTRRSWYLLDKRPPVMPQEVTSCPPYVGITTFKPNINAQP